MKWLLYFFISCSATTLCAQEAGFAAIDHYMIDIPNASTHSTDAIAAYINANYHTEKEKCRAAYRWVTYNIKYDRDSMYVFNWGGDPARKVTDALRRRKGVCENYAAILNEIVMKCGIQAYIISGYTKQFGYVQKNGHSWNAVNIDSVWLLYDPTWDEGYGNRATYFLTEPVIFIESHLPYDPLWQLLEKPVSQEQFYTGNLYSQKGKIYFNYNDSVKVFLKMDELQQLESTAARIREAGIGNEQTRLRLAYVNMQASIIYESKDMNDYNAAVYFVNKAGTIFNDFVQYRNNQFTPFKSDAEISGMLSPIDALISDAEKKLDEVDKSLVNAQYDTGDLRIQINNFRVKVEK